MNSAAPTSRLPRLDSLTGLRWWAAFGVFAYHMDALAPLPCQELFHIGYTGVSFFFVLSGFVLTWSASPTVTYRQFWWRRFARIWPAHIVALIIALFVFYTWTTPAPEQWWVKTVDPVGIGLSIVLLQGFAISSAIVFAGNPAAWTLSCEAFFYAIHPFVHSRVRDRQLGAYLLGGGAIALAVAGAIAQVYDVPLPAPFARVWEFLLGISAALLVKRGVRVSLSLWTVPAAIGLVGVWYSGILPLPQLVNPSYVSAAFPVFLGILYCIIIMMVATADITHKTSLFRARWMVVLGEWSYAFYLVHATVMYAFLNYFPQFPQGSKRAMAMWLLVFVLALVLSAALHHGVERPLEARLRRWGDRRFSQAAESSPRAVLA